MIVDYSYYTDEYKGQISDETEFDRLNLRAEDDMQMKSCKSLDECLTITLPFLKKAICSQIEYYYLNGDTYNDLNADSQSLGKFSYSGGSANNADVGVLSPRAKNYFNQTELSFVGVDLEAYS